MLLRHNFKELQLDDVDIKSVVILLNAVNKHYVGVTLVPVEKIGHLSEPHESPTAHISQ